MLPPSNANATRWKGNQYTNDILCMYTCGPRDYIGIDLGKCFIYRRIIDISYLPNLQTGKRPKNLWKHDMRTFPRQRFLQRHLSDACYGSRVWTSSRRLLAAHRRSKPQSLCQHNTRNHGNRCQVIAACLCPELPFLAGRSLSAP